MKNTITFETPFGVVGIEEEYNAVSRLYFTDILNTSEKPTPLLNRAKKQLFEYLLGIRKNFDLPFYIHGTHFQESVWTALQKIPYGETRSYKQIAEMVGNPAASRAVGMANNRNPLPIFIPCHRVIGANGSLTGYAYGLDLKKELLDLEKDILHMTNIFCSEPQ